MMLTKYLAKLSISFFGVFLFFDPVVTAKPLDPHNGFHWNGSDKDDWFEWWYYKVLIPDTNEAFYFVYGVVNPWDTAQVRAGSRSHIGFGSFADRVVIDERFPVSAFKASQTEANVEIAGNKATDRALQGRLVDAEGNQVSWDISVTKQWSFNAMGWPMNRPGLGEIYWYPAQASALMNGSIDYKGRHIVLKDAPAYQDRNWGSAFPTWWTWLVSNDFKDSPGTVFVAGGGVSHIVAGDHHAMGIGLLHKGKTYSFRTGDGATIKANVSFGVWEISATNRSGERVEISATAPKDAFLDIPFHDPAEDTHGLSDDGHIFHDYEALRGKMTVKLFKHSFLHGWQLETELKTDAAGIEFGSAEGKFLTKTFELEP